jgi:hypothetical protein
MVSAYLAGMKPPCAKQNPSAMTYSPSCVVDAMIYGDEVRAKLSKRGWNCNGSIGVAQLEAAGMKESASRSLPKTEPGLLTSRVKPGWVWSSSVVSRWREFSTDAPQ